MDIEHKIYLKGMVKAFTDEQAKHDALFKEVCGAVQSNIAVLSRKKKQKLIVDDYGQAQPNDWLRELDYYIANVLRYDKELVAYLPKIKEQTIDKIAETIARAPGLSADVRAALNQDFEQQKTAFVVPLFDTPLTAIIWQMVDQYQGDQVGDQVGVAPEPERMVNTGHDYENLCRELLTNLGWSVVHRGGSGDQGIDLIGELNGNRVVFQCKFYRSPVGNAAVQEVIAGMTYEGVSTGAVITNSSYTIAAKQLANTADVVLLHHDQLADFTALVTGHDSAIQ